MDIYVSQRASTSAPWGPPVNLGPTINTPSDEMCAFVSNDGHWLYFVSSRPGGCGGSDLYVSHRQNEADDFGWETPKNLGCTVNSTVTENGPALFEDEATGKTLLYFTSGRSGGPDIYVSPMVSPDTFSTSTCRSGPRRPAVIRSSSLQETLLTTDSSIRPPTPGVSPATAWPPSL